MLNDKTSVLKSQDTKNYLVEPLPEVIGLAGGAKKHYLKTHREEIIAYYQKFGEVQARLKYHIVTPAAWHSLFPAPKQPARKSNYKDKLQILVEIDRQDVRDLKREVSEMKEQFGQFVPAVADAVSKRIARALSNSLIDDVLPARESENEAKVEAGNHTVYVMSRSKVKK